MSARFASASPEEAQRGLTMWAAWSELLGDQLLDIGRPLGTPMTVTADGVFDGGSDVIGMSRIRAESRREAVALVQNHHHLAWGSITVLEEQVIPELA